MKTILSLILLFVLTFTAYGDNSTMSRGQFLKSLSKYDNNEVYRDFVRSRRGQKVGFQPMITVLPQGVSLNASAIISSDRRYIRMGLNPFFSDIGNVSTFNFGR